MSLLPSHASYLKESDDVDLIGKIAPARLKEFPDYYIRLAQLEAEADNYWAKKRQ